MPISNFSGDTFVAFIDISGFKDLLRHNIKAWKALDAFYQLGYDVLKTYSEKYNGTKIEGIFVSDCGILFSRGGDSKKEELVALLESIDKINRGMLEKEFMLTTSIAYGPFKYHERIEFQGIEKNAIYGGAYVQAYLDNTDEKSKIQPGQCRIVVKKLPEEVITFLDRKEELFAKVKKESSKHYYFYWNVDTSSEIEGFKEKHREAFNLKYNAMIKALKGIVS